METAEIPCVLCGLCGLIEVMIPHDYHMHSSFSCDGSSKPEKMCHQALKLGIPEIGFSEHWDVGPYETEPRFLQVESWFEEIERLRRLFSGKLIIRRGIEISQPHLYQSETDEVLKRAPFDYVIGSVHFVGSHFMFDEEYFRQHDADKVYQGYFEELLQLVTDADLDVVAHFDVPVRTSKPILGYEPTRYEGLIRKVLERVITRGLALDINTAGLRKPVQNLMPDPLILSWYAEMGGKRVTLGSDAHEACQVGMHLDKGLAAIQAAGIPYITQFEQRQARPLPLE